MRKLDFCMVGDVREEGRGVEVAGDHAKGAPAAAEDLEDQLPACARRSGVSRRPHTRAVGGDTGCIREAEGQALDGDVQQHILRPARAALRGRRAEHPLCGCMQRSGVYHAISSWRLFALGEVFGKVAATWKDAPTQMGGGVLREDQASNLTQCASTAPCWKQYTTSSRSG